MRYAVKPHDIRLRRVKRHEYNIAKVKGFYIAFAFVQKYRYKRQFEISLYVPKNQSFIFGCYLPFSKYVTHYDAFKIESVILLYKIATETTSLRSVSVCLAFFVLITVFFSFYYYEHSAQDNCHYLSHYDREPYTVYTPNKR